MTTTTRSRPVSGRALVTPLRSWRTAAGATALAGGGAIVAGCLLPWATALAGLVAIPGVRGSNGKLLAAAGVVLAAAGAWHLIRGDAVSRWLIGLLGTAVAGFSGYLLLQLAATMRSLGGESMMLPRGGPGLWVVAGGGVISLGSMFFPASSRSGGRALRADGAGLAAWAADRDSAGPRRWLQVGLGLAWLLDAALQFQPFMFTRGFVTQITDPAGMGSPGLVTRSVMGTGQIVLTHPAVFNAAFATIQLALAAGLFWRATTRLALAGTVVWGLGVWWLGEALGGLLAGTANPVTGAPGAALLYVLVAVLAWPAGPRRRGAGQVTGCVAADGGIGWRGAQLAWAVLWAGLAGLILQPGVRAPGALRDAIAGPGAGEPGWIAGLDRWAGGAIGTSSAVVIGLAIVFVAIAAGIYIPAARRPVLILAGIVALASWVVGQDFGGVLTGQGTDPGTGPLLILLAAAYWPLGAARRSGCTGAAAG